MSQHNYERKKKSDDDEEDEVDPVEEMVKKTGCLQQHYDVQDMGEHRDWRMCQEQVNIFKLCMSKSLNFGQAPSKE